MQEGSPARKRRSATSAPSRLSKQGTVAARALGIGIAVLVAVLAFLYGKRMSFGFPAKKPRWPNLVPFSSPQMLELDQFRGDHHDAYLWGTYRPGYYVGMRPRHPKSLVTGLMWVDFTRQDWYTAIRHETLHSDGLQAYNYLEHDGESFGIQQLEDDKFNMTTTFVKRRCRECGVGGDWALKVQAAPSASFLSHVAQTKGDETASPRARQTRPVISMFYYVATEDLSPISMDLEAWQGAVTAEDAGSDGLPRRVMAGNCPPFGRFSARVSGTGAAGFPVGLHWMGLRTPHTANLTTAVRLGIRDALFAQRRAEVEQYVLRLPDTAEPGSNVWVLQVTAWLPARLDVVFTSGKAADDPARVAALSGDPLRALLAQRSAAFNRRFQAAFPIAPSAPPGSRSVAKAALSGLLGGVGYWFGHSMVWVVDNWPPVLPNWDAPIFTASPSRPQFPRGFLWDEGFHQLLIRRWNPALSRDILAHWLDLMSSTGWIAREQILGEEARLRVPAEFVPQPTKAANPPSLFLVLDEMARGLAGDRLPSHVVAADRAFLERAWPRLRAWYSWLNVTQAGELPGSFRWRERDANTTRELNPRTLASGLDDYPRASHPTAAERHLDLRCWMALAARAMTRIARVAGTLAEAEVLAADAAAYADYDALKALHLDREHGRFADWGLHSEEVGLERPEGGGDLVRIIREEPRYRFVPHHGYISLFPLMLRLIPASDPQLGVEIESLRDAGGLLSPAGIRSLSRRSSLYGARNTEHDPPYWRGAVWININHLLIEALHYYATQAGPYQMLAAETEALLRQTVLEAVVEQFRHTGFLWEQYDDVTGAGKGAHPFTGWTALVALVAAGGGAPSP